MIDYIAYALVSAGVLINVLSALSVVFFPDMNTRLSASTKFVTLGTVILMFGIFVLSGFSATGIKALVCAFFIFLTSPVEAHALCKAAKTPKIISGDDASSNTRQ